MKTWSDAEVSVLLENYNRATNDELARLLPAKSKLGIYKKAYKLGLRKSADIEFLNRSESRRRERGSNWKGGIRITTKGYRQILVPEHPRADSSGYVMEHIYIWERISGSAVPKGCCVHHLNGNKSDNRPENLCLMTTGAHTAYHHTGTKRTAETCQKISDERKRHLAKSSDINGKAV